MSVAPRGDRNRIMIYGPKDDGTYIVEFRTAAGEALAAQIDRTVNPPGDNVVALGGTG